VFHPNSFINFHADDAWPEEDPPEHQEPAGQGVVIELLEDEEDGADAPQSVSSASPAASSPSPSLIEGGRGDVSSSLSGSSAQESDWSSISGESSSAGPSSPAPAARQEDWSLESRVMDSRRNMPSALVAASGEDEQIEFDSFALVMEGNGGPGQGVASRKTIAEGMQDPRRKDALMREFMAHVK
jgi:hypothetical protein